VLNIRHQFIAVESAVAVTMVIQSDTHLGWGFPFASQWIMMFSRGSMM